MAHNTKKLETDVDGKAIPQYYNKETDQYEPLEGRAGASKVITYDSNGEEVNFTIPISPILDKLNHLAGTAIDEEHRKANESNREAAEQNREASEILRETTEFQRDASEDVRQENEVARMNNYQELLNTGVLQTNINTKLEQLEEEYAPKMDGLEQQFNDAMANLTQDSEVIAGRTSTTTGGSYSTIGKRLDEMETMTVIGNHKAYFEIKDGRPRLRLEEF